jgi:hypothetical protein
LLVATLATLPSLLLIPSAPFAPSVFASKRVREGVGRSNMGSHGVTSLLARSKPSTKEQERAFDCEKEKCGDDVDRVPRREARAQR